MSKQYYLITGGAGFIGSNLVELLCEKYPEHFFIILDKLTYAGSKENLRDIPYKNYDFIQGDICDRVLVEELFEKHNFNGVYHLAAESHVDNSIEGPQEFIKTNIEGTFVLLHQAYKTWMQSPQVPKEEFLQARFLHVSTDEVFGSLGKEGLFNEDSPYKPNSPYSASKASSDFIVRSYYHTFGLNVVTTNCSNNFGPKQHDEKLIPTIIRNAIGFKDIPIYGQGNNVRDWLYVKDHCQAIDIVFRLGTSGETYNIGGNNEYSNNDLCAQICEILDELVPKSGKGKYVEQIKYIQDRHGHDFRYAIDSHKINTLLGWEPKTEFKHALIATVKWYMERLEQMTANPSQ